MITITAADAIDALIHIVDSKGTDFRYQIIPCKYAVDGTPSCGVGQALSHLGVPLQVISDLDIANSGTGLAARAMRPFLLQNDVDLNYEASRVLEAFQSVQDYGSRDDTATWGTALARANQVYNSIIQGA
jgi:hypothetical protein